MSGEVSDSHTNADEKPSNEASSSEALKEESEGRVAPLLRESLVSTAVKFLQSPAVSTSSYKDKQSFLQKKGLTALEIEEAMSKAQRVPSAHSNSLLPHKSENRFRNWTLVTLLFGGVIYSCYKFCKDILIPFLAAEKSETENIASRLTENTTALVEFGEKLEQLQQTCEKNSQKIDEQQLAGRAGTSGEIKELKDELLSLKRLLLSRHQFPETPQIKPVIPAWQLEEEKQTELASTNIVMDSSASEHSDKSPADSEAVAGSSQAHSTDSELSNSVSSNPTLTTTANSSPTTADSSPTDHADSNPSDTSGLTNTATARVDAQPDVTSNGTTADKTGNGQVTGGAVSLPLSDGISS